MWREIGVEVSVAAATMADYLEGQKHPVADIQVGRWIADYDDPDDFTFGLFHSKNGHWKAFYSSEEADRILEEARVESRAAHREGLYRKFEQLLLDEAVLIPLFHEIDYRIAAPSVRGVVLSSTPPFVSYGDISKVRAERTPRAALGGGAITVPIPGVVNTLDPSQADSYEDAETVGERLRDAHPQHRGRKDRPVARLGDRRRGGRHPLSLPPPPRREVPRRTDAHVARRPLLVRADSSRTRRARAGGSSRPSAVPRRF